MRYVGLDVHYGTSTYCVLDENGRESRDALPISSSELSMLRLCSKPPSGP
jgi:hypothetical protein